MDDSSLKEACVLGRGSYGSVTLVGDPQSRAYAKKTSSMSLLTTLQKELDIMLRFRNHPCIVQAKSPIVHFENNKTRSSERVCYIYMEYANKHTLEKMISKFGGRSLPGYMIQRAAFMILQGLEALHAKGYVHCDLKPDNILLFHSSTHGEPFDVKLSDFGLSKAPNSGYSPPRGSMFPGTPLYMPPESLGPNGVIEPVLDIWSLGCVVSEMFGGEPEEMGDSYMWKLSDQGISTVAKDFLRRCHVLDPLHRATAVELLKHPFITQRLYDSVPVPLPIKRQQKEDWPMIPRLPGSIW